MNAFFVRWRSARQFREFEFFADEIIGEAVLTALEQSGGLTVWQAGTIWKCPGCGDRTVRSEEFLEGLRLAAESLQAQPHHAFAAKWTETLLLKMFGCERDRIYLKDAGNDCRFAAETYISRI